MDKAFIVKCLYLILISLLLFSKAYCQHEIDNKIHNSNDSIQIGSNILVAKISFEFNSLINATGDTLKLATCAEFAYSPFGLLKNKKDVQKSDLKNFKVSNKIQKLDGQNFEFQILTLKSSRLILFFDKDQETKGSYVFKGEIRDSQVNFTNGIKIGMTKEEFLLKFFDIFPASLVKRYNVIVFESCVNAITHVYSFENNKLISVKFIPDSYWAVEY